MITATAFYYWPFLSGNALHYSPYLPITIVLSKKHSVLFYPESEVELFFFSGTGAVNCSDYFRNQSDRILEIRGQVKLIVNRLAADIAVQYGVLIGKDYLQKEIEEAKLHHPFKHAEQAGVQVDWVNLRNIQRVEEESNFKVSKILRKAQFVLEASIARILQIFWKRLQLTLHGITKIKPNKGNNPVGYWAIADVEAQNNAAKIDNNQKIKCKFIQN